MKITVFPVGLLAYQSIGLTVNTQKDYYLVCFLMTIYFFMRDRYAGVINRHSINMVVYWFKLRKFAYTYAIVFGFINID